MKEKLECSHRQTDRQLSVDIAHVVDTAAVCSSGLWADDIMFVVVRLKGAVIFPDVFCSSSNNWLWCCAALDIVGVLMNEMIRFADVLKRSEGLGYLGQHKLSNWSPFLSPKISFLTATQATQTHVQNNRCSCAITWAFQEVLGLNLEVLCFCLCERDV